MKCRTPALQRLKTRNAELPHRLYRLARAIRDAQNAVVRPPKGLLHYSRPLVRGVDVSEVAGWHAPRPIPGHSRRFRDVGGMSALRPKLTVTAYIQDRQRRATSGLV